MDIKQISQAHVTNELKRFTGLKDSDYVYKPLQPLHIVKGNAMTTKVVDIISGEFVNPFGNELENSKLYNLSSGIPVDESECDGILNIFEDGNRYFKL